MQKKGEKCFVNKVKEWTELHKHTTSHVSCQSLRITACDNNQFYAIRNSNDDVDGGDCISTDIYYCFPTYAGDAPISHIDDRMSTEID